MTLASEVASLLGDKPQVFVPLTELRSRVRAMPTLSAAALATECLANNVQLLRQTGVLVQTYGANAIWAWRPKLFE